MPPPGDGVETVTLAVPAVAMSAAEIDARSCVALKNVVGRSAPFHRTIDDGTKLLPLTVRLNAAVPAVTEAGESDVATGTGRSRAAAAAAAAPQCLAAVAGAASAFRNRRQAVGRQWSPGVWARRDQPIVAVRLIHELRVEIVAKKVSWGIARRVAAGKQVRRDEAVRKVGADRVVSVRLTVAGNSVLL